MIYNFVQFLRDVYPDVTFFVNEERITTLPERYSVIVDTGGQDSSCLEEKTFQIRVHDKDTASALVLAEEIYYTMLNNDNWHGRFNLTLPAASVKTIVYPSITISSIKPIQKPYYLGLDKNGRGMYVFNLIFRR